MQRIKRILIFMLISCTAQLWAQSPPTVSGNLNICDGATTTLTASGESGASFDWYTVATGGTPIFSGQEFTTPALNTSTNYYVEQTTGAGTSGRTLQRVDVHPIPNPSQPFDVMANPPIVCEGEGTTLSASVDVSTNQVVYWYDSITAGNIVGITDSGEPLTFVPQLNKTYYAQSVGISNELTKDTFSFTGGVQTFTVPAGIYNVEIDAYGARGGDRPGQNHGKGGRVRTSLAVYPGQVLQLYVGGAGGYTQGGWNGGGSSSGVKSTGGGGATDIRFDNTTVHGRIVVAGGGGGVGENNNQMTEGPGHGGGLDGANGGYAQAANLEVHRGKGGKQSSGGRRGCWWNNDPCASNGGFGNGGNGNLTYDGGGGGGGWYGGGGGAFYGQGGGGSSYANTNYCSNVLHEQGVHNGSGMLIISYNLPILCGSNDRVAVPLTVGSWASLVTTDSILYCSDQSLELTAEGADQYLWQPINQTGNTVSVTLQNNTTYTLIGMMDITGCNDTTTIDVTIDTTKIIPPTSNILCSGSAMTLSVEGATTYNWMPGNLNGDSITVNPTETTTYVVEGLNPSGCSTFDSIEIEVIPNLFDLMTSSDTTISTNSQLELNATGSDSIVWSLGAYGSTVTTVFSATTTITVTGYSLEGCIDTDTINVTVQEVPLIAGTTIIAAGENTILSAYAPDSSSTNFAWYDAPVGGNLLSSLSSYTTPNLNTNTVYYVAIDDGSGSSLRKPIQINVIDPSDLIVAADQDTICPGDNTNLSGTLAIQGMINWYDAPTEGNLLGVTQINEGFNINASTDTTFYGAGETKAQVDSFYFTGAVQTFTVPDGVTSINVNAFGGEGGLGRIVSNGSRSGVGGKGGRVETTLDVTPGEILHIYVGGKGEQMEEGDTDPNFGGWNGGGHPPGYLAGGGGGATDIRSGGTNFANRIIVAGGGGGGSGHFGCPTVPGEVGAGKGGAGGGTIGGIGTNCQANASQAGGGTQTGPGTNISCDLVGNRCGYLGTFGRGGNGYAYPSRTGGGGGGGWYGGNGGGIYSTGGGGSSFTSSDRCANVTHTQGVHSGDGLLIISYSLDASSATRTALPITVETIELSANYDTICAGNSVELMASHSDNYTWMPGNISGDQQTFSPLVTTTYVVEALSNEGCMTYDSITIYLKDLLQTTQDTMVLPNALTTLSSFGADSIVWSNGIEGSFNEIFVTQDSQFIVTGYSPEYGGCTDSDTVNVSIVGMPLVIGTTIIAEGNNTSLLATAPPGYGGTPSFNWYDAFEGGNLLSTSDTYVSPTLDNDAVYFVEMIDGTYTSIRKRIQVNVFNTENLTIDTEQDTICVGANTNLTGSMDNPGLIHWYDAPTGGNLLGTIATDEDYNINPSSTTTYYALGETRAQIDSFHFTGAVQTFTVPDGVTSIVIDAYGGAGGDGDPDPGGDGGRVEATLNVSPGEVLHLYVGGEGEGYVPGDTQNNQGGWNGGGSIADDDAGAGGGASDIRIGGTSLIHRILVAGGGGGGTGFWCDAPVNGAGSGGGTTGGSGNHCWSISVPNAGGGTQTGPGTVISCDNTGARCGDVGGFGFGGDGFYYVDRSGGGGGGGWYGGNGGGIYSNGGGGSSYTHPDRCANVIHTQGVGSGDGLIVISYSLNDNTPTRTALTVEVEDYLDLLTTGDTMVLTNAITVFSALGADSVVWSNGIEGPTNEIFVTEAIQLIATGYDYEFGCVEIDTVNISIGEMPLATGTTIILKGTSTTLVAEPPLNFRGLVAYNWYDAFEGGNLLSTSDTYVTPPLNNNAVYFVEMTDGAYSTIRKCITVNVIDAESLAINAEQDTFCLGENTNLSGTLENPGLIHWYDSPMGGNLLETTERNENYNISPSATTTYFAAGETRVQVDSFLFTGAVQTFTVPDGVTSIIIDAYGGAGGDGDTDPGADGGLVEATLNVKPGEILHLYVGGEGEGYVAGDTQHNQGGWNGGGSIADDDAGAGGGASDIRIGGTTLTHRILVAGGGGGGSGYWCDAPIVGAGVGGGTTGGSGTHCVNNSSTNAGGGTQTGPSTLVSCDPAGDRCGYSGNFGTGGDGYYHVDRSGGGGGGGWYGGNGGGIYCNGGGGSSYTHPDRCANVIHTQGVRSGAGLIVLTYSLDDNTATRTPLTIGVGDFEAPIPDVSSLPTETDDISLTLTAPTATDDCAGLLTATTTDPTTYNSPGTYTVTWEYDDGNGHVISQQQMVIIGNNLPVELVQFTGFKRKATVELNWTTANELDSRGFEVQRSIDGRNWERLGFINSQGNSNSLQHYSYTDTHPIMKTNYYRLLLEDQDGSFEYSNIIQIHFELGQGKIQVFPNPTSTGQFTVLIDDPNFSNEHAHIITYNQLGHKVLEEKLEQNRLEVDTQYWPVGQYVIRIESHGFSWHARVIVVRD